LTRKELNFLYLLGAQMKKLSIICTLVMLFTSSAFATGLSRFESDRILSKVRMSLWVNGVSKQDKKEDFEQLVVPGIQIRAILKKSESKK